jgi:hypothetical protein
MDLKECREDPCKCGEKLACSCRPIHFIKCMHESVICPGAKLVLIEDAEEKFVISDNDLLVV